MVDTAFNERIARPGRTALVFPGQWRPVGLPRINWTHPLAESLLFYAYDMPELSGVVDLVSGGIVTSALSTTLTQFGYASVYAGTARVFTGSPTYVQNVTAGNFSWACAFYKTGTAASFATPFGRQANGGGSQPFCNWDFEINVSGVGQTQMQADWNGSGNIQRSGNLTIADNTFTTAVGIMTGGAGTGTQTSSVNGVSAGGSTFNQTPQSNTTNDNIQIGGIPGYVFYGAFWSRPLSQAECALLHTDPYCFLLYDHDETAFPLTSVTASPTVYMVSGSRAGMSSVAIYDTTNLTTMVSDIGAELSYTFSTSANANITGVAGTGGVGTVTTSSVNSASITGVGATGGVGTLRAEIDIAITGVAATSAVGTLTDTAGSSVTLTGVSVTTAAGSPSIEIDATVTLTGVAATSAAGTARVEIDIPITGVSVTTAAGSPTILIQVPITGVAVTMGAGAPSVFHDVSITGVQINTATGIPLAISGPNMTTVTLPSIHLPVAAGTLHVALSVPITGVHVTTSTGALRTIHFIPDFTLSNLNVTTNPPRRTDRNLYLRWSDTAGASWSQPIGQDLGAPGQYERSILFQRLGIGRNRVWELSWSGALDTALQGAWVQAHASKS